MKKTRNNSRTQNRNEHSEDPILVKKADFISDKLKEKEKEIGEKIKDLVESSINDMKRSTTPDLIGASNFTGTHSDSRKIEYIKDIIDKKKEGGEIKDHFATLLKNSIGQNDPLK